MLYDDFFVKFSNNTENQFELLIEMTVEFVKTESSVLVEDWEQEGNFFFIFFIFYWRWY